MTSRSDLAGGLVGLRHAHEAAHPARPTVPRLALSPNEAAAALGVSRDFLDEHVAPELRWVRRGRRKFVAVAELERWLERAATLTLGPPPQSLPSEER
jgi:hypothetical protein